MSRNLKEVIKLIVSLISGLFFYGIMRFFLATDYKNSDFIVIFFVMIYASAIFFILSLLNFLRLQFSPKRDKKSGLQERWYANIQSDLDVLYDYIDDRPKFDCLNMVYCLADKGFVAFTQMDTDSLQGKLRLWL